MDVQVAVPSTDLADDPASLLYAMLTHCRISARPVRRNTVDISKILRRFLPSL
jgi:hypothetical protein